MAAAAMAQGRGFSSASHVNASGIGMSASALMCGPSPYLTSTPRRCGCSNQASPRKRGMKRNMGDIRDVEIAARYAHQQVDPGDADGVKQGRIEMVSLDGPKVRDLGNRRGPIAQHGRVNVVGAG